jgi:hypothetical protein
MDKIADGTSAKKHKRIWYLKIVFRNKTLIIDCTYTKGKYLGE